MGRLKNTPWKEILNNKFKYDISDDYTLEIRHAISKVRIFCAPAARAEGARRGAPVFFSRPPGSEWKAIKPECL